MNDRPLETRLNGDHEWLGQIQLLSMAQRALCVWSLLISPETLFCNAPPCLYIPALLAFYNHS